MSPRRKVEPEAHGPALGTVEASPVHRAVWERDVPVEIFESAPAEAPERIRKVMDVCIATVRRHRAAGTLYGSGGVISDAAIADLADAGYFGLAVGEPYGGSGAAFSLLAPFLAEMAGVDVWVSGLASCHAAIGPVSYLEAFGSEAQKRRLLPPLARGERLGAFAVTEPGTASDWSMIRTRAVRAGDVLRLSGEKLFITNAAPGRTIGVLCKIDERLEMVVVEAPRQEDAHFRTLRYGLRAPLHITNRGLVFDDLEVPADNRIQPPYGDGRTIAFFALNRGRVAICAWSGALMRVMIANLVPWVRTRESFGAHIGTRELVRRRLGRLAGRAVACDALVAWTSQLLDAGHRGELECVVAKVFGSEALKEATVDILLKTQGARALLPGNMLADLLPDLLAPPVYEGENEILTLGFFNSLTRAHRKRLLEPLSHALGHDGALPVRLAAAGRTMAEYLAWLTGQELGRRPRLGRGVPLDLDGLTDLATDLLHRSALELSSALRRYGARIAERQAAAFELAHRVQQMTAMLVTCRWAARQPDALVRQAGVCMAAEIAQQLVGARPSAGYQRLLTELGGAVADGHFEPAADLPRAEVLLPGPIAPLAPPPAPEAQAIRTEAAPPA